MGLKGILILFVVWFALLAGVLVIYNVSNHKREDSRVSLAIMSKEEAVSRCAGGVIRLPQVDVAVQYGADVLIPDNEPGIQTQFIVEYSEILAQYWKVNSCRVTGGEIQQLGNKRYWIYTIYPTTRKSPIKSDLHTASLGQFQPTQEVLGRKPEKLKQFNISGFLYLPYY